VIDRRKGRQNLIVYTFKLAASSESGQLKPDFDASARNYHNDGQLATLAEAPQGRRFLE